MDKEQLYKNSIEDLDLDEREGSIRKLLDNVSAIALQLDNSGLLQKTACRLMGGYFKGTEFVRDTRYKPKINRDGFKVIEHFLDLSTDPNSVLSNKDKKEIQKACFILSIELLIDLLRHYKKYDLDIEDISPIVLSVADAMYSGQKRAIGGQTAKALNQIVKQVENIFREQKEKTGGFLNLKT